MKLMTTKLIITADLHGYMPIIPEGDVLLIAGDICPNKYGHGSKILEAAYQLEWFNSVFIPWVNNQPVSKVLITWENHDIVGSLYCKFNDCPKLVILNDKCYTLNEFKIVGTPWSVTFGGNWAFNKQDKDLKPIYENIPEDTDILLSHGPPFGYGDKCPSFPYPEIEENVGSISLIEEIKKRNIKLVCFGHIHEGYGIYERQNTLLINGSYVNSQYSPTNAPLEVDYNGFKNSNRYITEHISTKGQHGSIHRG